MRWGTRWVLGGGSPENLVVVVVTLKNCSAFQVTGARGRRKLEHAGSERAGEEVGDLRNRRKKQVSPSHLGGANPKFSPQKRSALGQVEDAARRGIIPSEYRRRAVQRGGKKHWPLAMGVIDSTQCQTRMIRKTEA